MQQAETKVYPTPADSEGFYFEDKTDETLDIKTRVYENGSKVKVATLSTGQKAMVRELLGKDQKEIHRFSGQDQEKYITAGITVATLIDDKRQPFEFYEAIKMKDYNTIMGMYTSLNF